MKAVLASVPRDLLPEINSALEASGVVGIWHANQTSHTAILDEGAAELLAGDVTLAGRVISSEAIIETIYPDDREMVLAKLGDSTENCTNFIVEHRVLLPEGRIRWVQGRGRFDQCPDGSICGRGIVLDITEDREQDNVVTMTGHVVDRRDPLDVAAAHTIAAREAILRTGSGSLRAAVDRLLLTIGRAIARVPSS